MKHLTGPAKPDTTPLAPVVDDDDELAEAPTMRPGELARLGRAAPDPGLTARAGGRGGGGVRIRVSDERPRRG